MPKQAGPGNMEELHDDRQCLYWICDHWAISVCTGCVAPRTHAGNHLYVKFFVQEYFKHFFFQFWRKHFFSFISSAFIVEVLGKKLLSHQLKQENKSPIITLLQDTGGNVFSNFICNLNRGPVSLLIFYHYVFKIKMYHLPKEYIHLPRCS